MADVLHKCERKNPGDFEFIFFCPGCRMGHGFKTDGPGPCWSFNGDMEKPTIRPSIRVFGGIREGVEQCHCFVRDGTIQFLDDSDHELAGQTVALEAF